MEVSSPEIRFQEHLLSNGLQVILYRDNRVPLVHVTLHYRVGSSYESPGLSGLAHLFEHLMFEGSENVKKNEHGKLLDTAGGTWNASTNKDRTNYYSTVPSNYLDLALWLEADRMRSLNLTRENFENQRQTVIEERKQSYDNRPYGRAHLRFDELAYSNWAYAHSVIGSLEDLERLTLDDGVSFHDAHYGPGRTVLVLAGDIQEEEALQKVTRYFGELPNRTSRFQPDLGESAQTAPRQEEIQDPLATLPVVMLGYHVPPLGSDDYYALSLLSLALAHGDSSRLYRRLIFDNNWATNVYAGPNQYKGPQLFTVWCQLQSSVTTASVLDAVREDLQRVCKAPLDDHEIQKTKNNVSHAFLSRLTRVSYIGESLARYAIYLDDANAINTELDRFLRLTGDDLQEAADRAFRDENETLITVEPARRPQ